MSVKVVCSVKDCDKLAVLDGLCFKHSKNDLIKDYNVNMKKLNREVNLFKKKKLDEFFDSNPNYFEVLKLKSEWELACLIDKEKNKKKVVDNENRKGRKCVKNNVRGRRCGGIQRFRQERELLF